MTVTLSNSEWSYASSDEALLYVSKRGLTAFAGLTAPQVDPFLTIAREYMAATYEWEGSITDLAQVGDWPRTDLTDKEGRTIASDAIPEQVKQAQIELAIAAEANSNRLLDNAGAAGVKSVKAGSVSVTFSADSIPSEAQRFLLADRLVAQFTKSRLGASNINFAGIVRS